MKRKATLRLAMRFVTALAVVASAACAPRASLRVDAASPQLRQEMGTLAAGYRGPHGFRIALAEKPAAGGASLEVGWSFVAPPSESSLQKVSADRLREAGYSTALAFERWARDGEGWREVPILWDAWGLASPSSVSASRRKTGIFEWKDRGALTAARLSLMVPGAEPGARQSLFWLASSELPETGPMAKIMADASYRTDPAHIRYFKAFASIGKDAALFPGSMVMMKPDVENLARVGRVDLPLGSYAWLRGMQGIGRRDFRSLAYPFSEGYAIPVALLVGRITGKGRSAAGARDFLLWLLSLENQKRLSEMTGYMAANFNAANLDQNALAAREAATAAERIVPIDPEPAQRSVSAAWDSLLGRILAKPSEWERVLAEKENG